MKITPERNNKPAIAEAKAKRLHAYAEAAKKPACK